MPVQIAVKSVSDPWELEHTHSPLSSSFLGLPYRILNINHKKELLRGLWVSISCKPTMARDRKQSQVAEVAVALHHRFEEDCRVFGLDVKGLVFRSPNGSK